MKEKTNVINVNLNNEDDAILVLEKFNEAAIKVISEQSLTIIKGIALSNLFHLNRSNMISFLSCYANFIEDGRQIAPKLSLLGKIREEIFIAFRKVGRLFI